MSSVAELQNVFTREEYPPNEKGQSDVPLSDIYADLVHRFPNGWTVKVVGSGVVGNQGYILVEVHLPLEEGKWFVVPGAAQGPIAMPGLLTLAIRNALLRHAGMGGDFYENDDANFQNNNNGGGIPGSPFGQGDQHANYQNQPPNGNGSGYQYQPPPNQFNQNGGYPPNQNGYQNNNGGNRGTGNYGPWTGEVIIKSGQFQGLKWAQLPGDVLQNMASKGNVLANKELSRRNGGG